AHRKRAQALATVAPVRGEPVGAALEYLAYPVQRLHVVLQGRPTEEAHLRDVRRAQPRHAALALDRLDHRRFLAADVGARAAAEMNRRLLARRIFLQRGDFLFKDRAAAMVLVTKIDIDLVDADRPGRDERALDEAVRIAFEIPAVLEGAGLALVDVDRHQARRRLRGDRFPLAPRREARTAESPQARIFHDGDDVLALSRALDARLGERVAVFREIRGVIDVRRTHDLHVRMAGRGMLHG